MVSSDARPNWGPLNEWVYVVPHRTIRDLMVRVQADATTVDTIVLICVRENAVSLTDVCFEMDENRFENLM
jgi:hypothetical protein